jgi:hypothetical protein
MSRHVSWSYLFSRLLKISVKYRWNYLGERYG